MQRPFKERTSDKKKKPTAQRSREGRRLDKQKTSKKVEKPTAWQEPMKKAANWQKKIVMMERTTPEISKREVAMIRRETIRMKKGKK